MRAPLHAICMIAGLCGLAMPALAFEPGVLAPGFDPDSVNVRDAATPAPASADPAFGDATLAGSTLDDLRGGSDTSNSNNKTINTAISDVDGRVDDNIAANVVTGANLVDGGAFGNAAGLSTVIQNSGNNVLIQNSTVVTIQFAPTP